jgi:hypothetical protein
MTNPHWLGRALLYASWGWVALVNVLTFWKAWEIPARMPEINEVATIHLFLFPITLLLFFSLSWIRQRHDNAADSGPRSFARWRATLGIWLLAVLHPVSCGIYPWAFNLDDRTVEGIIRTVETMKAGMTREEVEEQIMTLNAMLPVSMGTDLEQHHRHQREVSRYLEEKDPAVRRLIWPVISRATYVFVPWSLKPPAEPDREAREQLFQRRMRATSDIGVDRIKVRYGPSFTVEEVVYSSNRQLTMERQPCTVHIIVPAQPATSFPYPCLP